MKHKPQQSINILTIEENKTRDINKRGKRGGERETWINENDEEILQ